MGFPVGHYVSNRVLIGEKWQAMLGARSSRYQNVTPPTRYEADVVSPSVSLMYKPVSGVSVYGSYLEALEESGTAPTTTANVCVMNGLAHYKGIELAASGEVTKQLVIVASTVFMNAKLLNTANAATFGKTPDNTPERTASLFAEYRLQDVPGLALSGGLYYVGKRAVNDANQAFFDSYTTLPLAACRT